jgi:Spy/CpxP family protein refolding chaperone
MSRLGALLLASLLLCGIALAAQTSPATAPPSVSQPSQQPQATPAPGGTATPGGSAATGEPSAQQQAHSTLEHLGPELNLTADQKTKLETILSGEIQQVRDLRADTSMTVEQKQAKFKETLTADHAKIDSILTPEQKQKLTQLNQQRAAQQGQGGASTGAPSQGAAPSQSAPPSQAPTTPQNPK